MLEIKKMRKQLYYVYYNNEFIVSFDKLRQAQRFKAEMISKGVIDAM